jgi:formylglycine-generating enzyme required for sulfatase activity
VASSDGKQTTHRNSEVKNVLLNCIVEYAVEFCGKLSQKTGKKYRLLSEAEWEYACRAGTTTPFHFGETITPELVNYDGGYYEGGPPTDTQPA